jgi:uncharacterized protein YggE
MNDGDAAGGAAGEAATPGGRRGARLTAVAVLVAAVVVAGLASGLAVVAGGGPGPATAGAADAPRCGAGTPSLSVTGTGKVTITPDLLTLSLDVSTTAANAGAALSANNADTAAVLQALSAGGVAGKDLQTTNLSVQANYAGTGSVVSGYAVDNTVVAKIRSLPSAGTLIDAAVSAGGDATRIDSLTFSLTDSRRPEERARALAVREAVGRAASMASAAGERLGGICSLKDETSGGTPVIFGTGVHVPAASASSGRVPVEPGTQTVTARVAIVYALTTPAIRT